MNNIADFSKCSNCGACINICPKGAIIVDDKDVFYKIKVDNNKCISCGVCKKICPVNSEESRQKVISAYALVHKDEEIVRKSSSGGAFTAIAEEVLALNGVVFGAVFKDGFKKVVISSSDNNTLDEIRRSKYVESLVEYSFKEVKRNLENNRFVLYCGAPCQIAGLKRYLIKDYDKLITLDFSCGGMPSHKIYEEWLYEIEKKLKAPICDVNFRPKTYGWSNHAILIRAKNKNKYSKLAMQDMYFDSFVGTHSTVRSYCYECDFSDNHYSDIILADLWKYRSVSKVRNQNKGISLIITNSSKGENVIKMIQKKVLLTVLDKDKATYNLVEKKKNVQNEIKHKEFFEKYKSIGFAKMMKENKNRICFKFKVKYIIKKMIGWE